MPITSEQEGTHWLIRLEGEFTLGAAGELKKLLLEWQASGSDLQLDLERAAEFDLTLLQLLVAAGREGAGSRSALTIRVSPEIAAAVRDAGFDRFPGETAQVKRCPR